MAREAYERPAYQTYLRAVCDRTVEIVEEALRRALNPHEASVTSRLKEPASFEEKASRTGAGGHRYMRPLSGIHDQVGVRVVVLHNDYLEHARDLLQASPLVVEHQEDKSIGHAQRHTFGYRSIHLGIRPPEIDGRIPPEDPDCGRLQQVEIQVRTQAQHAWAEIEHRLRYKNDGVDIETSRKLDQAAALLEIADNMFQDLIGDPAALQVRGPTQPDATPAASAGTSPSGPATMSELLNRRFPQAAQPTPATLEWIERCALSLFGDAAALDRALAGVPLERIERVFAAVGHSPRSQARQLDDALLWIGRGAYIDAAERSGEGGERVASGRSGILRWRLERMEKEGIVR
jgi:ppGpp synthetase/RelA/SpoT-type nucleotidyltranferase